MEARHLFSVNVFLAFDSPDPGAPSTHTFATQLTDLTQAAGVAAYTPGQIDDLRGQV